MRDSDVLQDGRLPMITKIASLSALMRLALILVLGIGWLAAGISQAATINDVFAGVAMRVPEFAGVHVDERQNVLYVHLRNGTPDHAQAVLAELRTYFGDQQLRYQGVQVVPASFRFSELKRWHDRAAPDVLEHSGVTFIGIDHANNRVVIGVEDSSARSPVELQLSRADVPREAVNFMETGPIEVKSSLNDKHVPLVGGLEIGTSFSTCTLGFNARRAGVSGFVTASHCSNTGDVPPGKIGTVYAQPSGGGRVGVEAVDPGFHGCYCLFGICALRCRASDSAFVATDASISSALGSVARPIFTEGIISTAWDGVSTFRITGGGTPFPWKSISKIGSTTGRTDGHVVVMGVTVPILAKSFPYVTRKLLEDQVIATGLIEEGDSGGPVIHLDGGDNASLEGIAWAGLGSVLGLPGMLYSPISGVQKDLGPLTFEPSTKPDLVPVSPPGSTNFCEISTSRRVNVRVMNVGGAPAKPSTTRVDFPPYGFVELPKTDWISPGGFVDLDPIVPPSGCFDPDCNYVVTVDRYHEVDEGPAGEANNTAVGTCI